MVRAVMGLVACVLAAPVAAMGPDDPFTPPGRVRPPAQAPASGPAGGLSGGFAGVRLGRVPAALIDGQWLVEGAAVRGARLVRVQAAAVELRHADGRIERLQLFNPDAPPPAAAAASDPADAALKDVP